MPRKKNKPSRHGTLAEDDTVDAVPISVNQVLAHYQSANTKDLFGAAGALPPKSAVHYEPHYVKYHVVKDIDGAEWIGLNRMNNAEKGVLPPVQLVPGEYKLELKLDKELNRNIAHEFVGGIVGGIQAMALTNEEKAQEAARRGVPNAYLDVHLIVQAKKYAVADIRGTMDLGNHSCFTRTFAVTPNDGNEVQMELELFSHTLAKRLKVSGVLYRRDFAPEEPDYRRQRQQRTAAAGKAILQQALSSGERLPAPQPSRLDADVDLRQVVTQFYSDVAPDRLGNVEYVLNHFDGRENDLINTLEAKYQVKFDCRGNYERL